MSEKDNDLTKLTDLSEFEHELDQATEDYFQKKSKESNLNEDNESEELTEDNSLETQESFTDEDWENESKEEFGTSENQEEPFEKSHPEENPLSDEDLTITDWNEFEEKEEESTSFLAPDVQDEIAEETEENLPESIEEESHSSIANEIIHEELQELEMIFDPMLNFDASSEGNPPFSILIEEIQEAEVQKLFKLLKKYSLVQDNEKESLNRIQKGEYLIPRISEFACIIITRELKHYPFKLTIGPSDKVFSSSFYIDPHPGGLPTFENIDHNKNAHIKIGKKDDKS